MQAASGTVKNLVLPLAQEGYRSQGTHSHEPRWERAS